MKTLDQLRKEFESHSIPYLTIDETAMLFSRLAQLEEENAELKRRLDVLDA